MKYSLFLNGGELLRVDNGKYFVSNNIAMEEVDKDAFKVKLEKMRNVCEHSWDINLQTQYKEMWDIINYVPQAVLGITNTFVISVKLSDDGESLFYVYAYDNPIEVPIEWNDEGEPIFTTIEGVVYSLNDFMRVEGI